MNSTPFHVRFGKMSGLLHPKERVVQVTCNGIKSSLKMKLDDQGEAFFVKETSVRPSDIDDDMMATSPIVSPLTSPVSALFVCLFSLFSLFVSLVCLFVFVCLFVVCCPFS